MSRLQDAIVSAVARGDRAFIPFLSAGHPDMETSEAALRELARQGADAIEIGFPFSDSLADGPVVQGAYHKALAAGSTRESVMAMIGRLTRDKAFPPVILMCAYNVIYRTGLDRFVEMSAKSGISAVLPPDLPVEEWCALNGALDRGGLDGIRLVAPTTPPERVETILLGAGGFLYYISRNGVTGARSELPEDLEESVRRLRALSPLPVAVGFGVSTPEQAATVGRFADGLVVGSALVKTLEAESNPVAKLGTLAGNIRAALRGLGPTPLR